MIEDYVCFYENDIYLFLDCVDDVVCDVADYLTNTFGSKSCDNIKREVYFE